MGTTGTNVRYACGDAKYGGEADGTWYASLFYVIIHPNNFSHKYIHNIHNIFI